MLLVLLAASGCLKPVAKVGCCAKENATTDEVCVMLNMTTSRLMPEYAERTESCNLTTGFCNVSVGGVYQQVPFCTDDELNDCINPDCTAMVCGDFLFKPKVAPGVIVDDEGLGTTDVPPEDESEDSVLGFYKAQCRFMPMDQQLAAIMKNTKSSLNVFRIGVGESFDEFDNYRYYFPISDKFCNLNAPLNPDEVRIDRYMNYLGVEGSNVNAPYDPEQMDIDCLDDSEEVPSPFGYGGLDYVSWPDCEPTDTILDESDYNFEVFCTSITDLDGDSTDWTPNKRIDRAFYRRGLSMAHAEDIYSEVTSRAPFECLTALDCYSSTCDSSFYARTVTVTESGSALTTDCYLSEDSYGKQVLVCAPTTNVNTAPTPEDPPAFTYATIPARLARISVRIQSYPSGSFSNEPADDEYTDCDGHDNVCELVQQWRDFSGLGLGEHGSTPGNLEYNLGRQVISHQFDISKMPIDYEFEDLPNSECDLSMLGGTGTVPCPIVGPQDNYPPAGGIVFFGSSSEPDKRVYWEGEEIIGYIIGPPSTSDLYEYMFIDRCAQTYEITLPPTVSEGADALDCWSTCRHMCVDEIGDPASDSGCSAYCHDEDEFPCETTVAEIVDPFGAGGRYIERVEVGRPDGANWQRLMDAFEPMFIERIESLQSINWEDGCGKRMESTDVIFSSIPWVLDYRRPDDPQFLSSESAAVLYDYDIYDRSVSSRFTELCSLRYNGNRGDTRRDRDYWMLYADYIYLIKKPEDNTLGSCEVNSVTGMPEVKTYGWCEPCTGSTIAFGSISGLYPYVPYSETIVHHEGTTSFADEVESEQICSGDFDFGSGYVLTCDAPWITDVQELGGNILETGSPRSAPIATTMKARLGDYMKSGILPVIDMSGGSNWDREDYSEYAFEDVYGDMGAVITIVYTIDMQAQTDETYIHGLATGTVRDEISDRMGILKSRCYRCMPAIWIRGIPDNESLEILLADLFSDPRLRLDTQIVAYDYTPPSRYKLSYQGDDEIRLADSTIDYMLSFSDKILEYRKPSIITGFSVSENSDVWTAENSEILFNRIMERSSEFVDNGAIGLIYSPAKTTLEPLADQALVDATGGPGVKGEKFCKFEKAVNNFLNPPPSTIFSLVPVYESVNCTNCTQLDYYRGQCSRTCSNGIECTVPSGADPAAVRCPAGAVVEPCTLCNETPGTYVCDYNYFNGTVTTREYPSSQVSSDLYLDVVGGIGSPDKCCLETEGTKYSYDKTAYPVLRSLPAVFPASGADLSCIGGAMSISSSFCGQEVVPMRNYDVNCTFVPG